eukprot:2424775-Rhodomonas_salina.1
MFVFGIAFEALDCGGTTLGFYGDGKSRSRHETVLILAPARFVADTVHTSREQDHYYQELYRNTVT